VPVLSEAEYDPKIFPLPPGSSATDLWPVSHGSVMQGIAALSKPVGKSGLPIARLCGFNGL
jgi:hypothetical protein